VLAAKAHALRGLRQRLEALRSIGRNATPPPSVLMRDTTLVGAAGARCETAIPLREGTGLRIAVARGASTWFRVDGDGKAPLAVGTRGSSVDPALAAFNDCRVADRAPLAQADDSFGLQAELALLPQRQTFWYVRADNLSEPGNLAISAMRAVAISGQVTAAATGAGLPNVQMSYFQIQAGTAIHQGTVYADSTGNYMIAAQAGTFALRTSDYYGYGSLIHQAYDGFTCASSNYYDILSCGSGSTHYTPIELADPAQRTINFALSNAGNLTGVLNSSAGGPVAGGYVAMYSAQGNELRNVATDSLGRWRLESVPAAGVYLVAGSSEHARTLHAGIECVAYYSCPWPSGTLITAPPDTTTRIDMTIRRQQYIDLTLTVDGEPTVASSSYEFTASLLNGNGAVVATSSSNGNGRFRIGPIAPGNYRLRVQSALAFPRLYPQVDCASDCLAELGLGGLVTLGASDGSVALAMDLHGYPALSGRLTDAGSGDPIVNIGVFLLSASTLVTAYSAASNAAGNYRFEAIAPGSYLVRFTSPHHVDEVHDNVPCHSTTPFLDCLGATLLVVGASSTDRVIDATLDPSGRIAGRVTATDQTSSINYAAVYLLRPDGSSPFTYSVSLDALGNFLLQDVPPGAWRVGLTGLFDLVPQVFRDIDCAAAQSNGAFMNCNMAQATILDVASGVQTNGVDFSVRRSGAQPVRVLNAFDEQPLSGIVIDTWTDLGQRTDSRTTDASGRTWVTGASYPGATPHALSTDNNAGFINEVYQDIECANGSVFFETCALTGFTPVQLPAASNAAPIVIRIARPIPIFGGNFEQ
jgi:hypothetical protein